MLRFLFKLIVIKKPLSLVTQIQSDTSSAVIWNPWIEKTARMADIHNDAWQDFVCIECGQIGPEKIQLKSKQMIQYQLIIG